MARTPRDRILPILLLSLVVHATIILPSLFGPFNAPPTPPKEIPVEVIQLPPPAKPKPPAQKPPTPKTAAPKPSAPKPEPKSPPPQKAAPKPSPPKAQPPKSPQKPPQQPAAKSIPDAGEQKFKDLLGAMPAIALPGASADGTDAVSYAQLVLSQVAKAKKQGRYRGVPGAASVTFTLDDNGGLASVAIVHPSGQQSLDDEAIAMIKRGAPYPPPPPGARRNFTITLRFEPLI